MKKLSKDEMKKVVGGDPPQVWCYACDFVPGCYPSPPSNSCEGLGGIVIVRCAECMV